MCVRLIVVEDITQLDYEEQSHNQSYHCQEFWHEKVFVGMH